MNTWARLRAKLLEGIQPGVVNPIVEHRAMLELLAEEIDRLDAENQELRKLTDCLRPMIGPQPPPVTRRPL